jgi:hypothetical protein
MRGGEDDDLEHDEYERDLRRAHQTAYHPGERSNGRAGRAAIMLIGWDRFTDADSDALGTGGRTVDMWMDCEVVRLLDAGLRAYYLGKEAYPTAPA